MKETNQRLKFSKMNKLIGLIIAVVAIVSFVAHGIIAYFMSQATASNAFTLQSFHNVTYTYYEIDKNGNATQLARTETERTYATAIITLGADSSHLITDARYTQEMYYKIEGVTKHNGDTYTIPKRDVTIEEYYTVATYDVTYNFESANGGQVSQNDSRKTLTEEFNIGENIDLTKTGYLQGYDFDGWVLDGTSQILSTLTMGDSNVTLNAVYTDRTAPNNTAPTADVGVSSITVTPRQEDNGSGIDNSTIEYQIAQDTNGNGVIDDNEWGPWQSSDTFTGLTEDTTYFVRTKAEDNDGNGPVISEATEVSTLPIQNGTLEQHKTDAQGEIIPLSTDNTDTTHAVNTDVYFDITPAPTGTTTLVITKPDGTTTTLTNDGTIQTETGLYEIELTTTDGQNTATNTYYIYVDKVNPTVNPQTQTTSNSITVDANAQDAHSGVSTITYVLKDGNTVVGTITKTASDNDKIATFTGLTQDKDYTLEVTATDFAGNTSTTSTSTVQTDELTNGSLSFTENTSGTQVTPLTNPTAADLADETKKVWVNEDLLVALTQGSEGTTSYTVEKISGTPSEATQTETGNTTINTTEGTYRFTVTTTDGTNTTAPTIYYINVDKTNPTVAVGTNGGNYVMEVGDTLVTLSSTVTGTDEANGSGVASVKYAWSTSNSTEPAANTWTTVASNTTTATNAVTTGGNYYLWTKAVDKAGNESTTIDKTSAFTVGYRVEYDMNTGVGTIASQVKTHGESLTLSSTIPTKTGYTFAGWSTNSAATPSQVQYQAGGSYTTNEPAKLYAVWDEIKAVFDTGENVNIVMKNLAGDNVQAVTEVDTNITAILKSSTAPAANVNKVDVSITNDPIYMWYDNGTIYWWSEDSTPSLNIDAKRMFIGMTNLSNISGLENFDASKTENIKSMFANDENLQNVSAIENWEVSRVKDMSTMFSHAGITSIDLSAWNTSSLENLAGIFQSCNSLTTIDLSGDFDTSNVTNMNGMFMNSRNITSITFGDNFVTSNVENMESMFQNNTSLTSIDVSNFDTSNAENMSNMFRSCAGLTVLDLTNFDTSSLTDASSMFYDCTNLTTIYATESFVTTNVIQSSYMFGNNTAPLDGGAGTTYNASNPKDKTYAHLDGGSTNPGYFRYNPDIYKYEEIITINTAGVDKAIVVKAYATLEEAFANATSGSTIRVLTNTTETTSATLPSGKTLTLDLDGKTITTNSAITNNGTLTIKDENGAITSTAASTPAIANNGTLTIGEDDNTVSKTGPTITGTTYGVQNNQGGTFNYYDGKIVGQNGAGSSISGSINAIPQTYSVQKTVENGSETAILMQLNYEELDSLGAHVNYYETLAEAFSNVTSGNTIKVLQNTTETQSATASNKSFTLNKDGKTITMANNSSIYLGDDYGGGTINFVGSGAITTPTTGRTTAEPLINLKYTNLTLVSGSGDYKNYNGTVIGGTNAVFTMYGGSNVYSEGTAPAIVQGELQLNITGGTIYGEGGGIQQSHLKSITIGTNDSSVSTTSPSITGVNAAAIIQDSATSIGFYDGILIGKQGELMYSINTPTGYKVRKTTADGVDTRILVQANYAEYNGSTIVNYYATLEDAFANVTSGNTIRPLKSQTDGSTNNPTVPSGKTLKLDLAGYEVTLSKYILNNGTLDVYSSLDGGELNRSGVLILNGSTGTLTTNGTSSSNTLAIVNTSTTTNSADSVIQNAGNLTLNTKTTLTYENASTSGTANRYVVMNTNGVATVNGATLTNTVGGTTKEYGISNTSTATNARIVVNSGTVEASAYAIWNNGSTKNTTTEPAVKVAGGEVKSTGGNAIYNGIANSMIYITGGEISSTGSHTIVTNGNYTMTGGTVKAYSGMGVHISGNGVGNVSGGLISKEKNPVTNAWVSGACFQLNGAATATLSGTAVIQNANGNSSNVIYNNSTGTLTIDGATVQNLGTALAGTNSTSGTIYVKSGTVSTNGQIAINNVGSSGTIVIGESGSTSTTSPIVTGEVRGAEGCGLITVNGGKISGTTGPTILSYESVTVNGGLIENNVADTGNNWPYTIAICSDSSKLTINGGTITNNTSYAVAAQDTTSGTIEINGGTITATENTAVKNEKGNTTITGGTITSTNGYGVSTSTGTVTIGNSEAPVTSIDNNTATEPRITGSTYGVQVGSYGTFNFYDGVIKGASGQSISKNPDGKPTGYTVRKTTANSIETAVLGNTYTVNFYQGNATSTAGATLLGTQTVTYGTAVNLRTYANLGGVFPYSAEDNAANSSHTRYDWTFAGWNTTTSGTARTYTNGQSYTHNTEADINLYAVGSKEFAFYGGIAPTSAISTPTQYWNPYSTATSQLTAIAVPNTTAISGWTFVGYKAGDSSANGTVQMAASLAGTSYTPAYNTYRLNRSAYSRTLTINYNANGGTGTTSATTATQYYNSGRANNDSAISTPSFTLRANGFTKTGYTFSKWADGSTSGTQYAAGATYNAWTPAVNSSTVAKTMYAIWTANKLTIKYYAGDATSDTNGVWTNTSNNLMSTATAYYDGTNYATYGLANANGGTWQLKKTGYHTTNLWHIGSLTATKTINADTKYAYVQDMATDMGVDLASGDQTVNLYPDWGKNTATIYYYPNGGSANTNYPLLTSGTYSGASATVTTVNYGAGNVDLYNCTTLFNRTGYSIPSNAQAWRKDSATSTTYINQASQNFDSYIENGSVVIKLYANWVDTAPTANDITGGTTLKATSQTVTISGTDGIGINAYYWGTTSPTSSSTFTSVTSTTSFSTTKSITAAGTYYFAVKDTNGSMSAVKSITIVNYTVQNLLETVAGTTGTYTSANYATNGSATTYRVKSGTTLTLTSIYTIPTGATAGTFKGYSTTYTTSTATLSTSNPTVASGATYYMWFNRSTYTLTINPNSGTWNGTTSNTTVTQKYGSTYSLANNPTRAGYVFRGWTLTNSGSFSYYDSSSTATDTTTVNYNAADSTLPTAYNNSGGGTVTNSMVADSTATGGYSLKVVTNGTASPGAGGIRLPILTTTAGRIQVLEIKAKIPSGYNLQWAGVDDMYTGIGSTYRSNDVAGTGAWKTYYLVMYGGDTGTLGSTAYLYVNGSNNTSVTWYVNSITRRSYTRANFKSKYTFGAGNGTLTANWAAAGSRVTFNANGGTYDTTKVKSWNNGYYDASSTAANRFLKYATSYATAPAATNYNWIPDTRVISRDACTFNGWYTATSGGTKVFNSDGTLVSSVSGYSNSSKQWIKYDANVTLYAQWTYYNYAEYNGTKFVAGYNTLATAFSGATSGNTIKVMNNTTETASAILPAGKTLTLDTNGKTINYTAAAGSYTTRSGYSISNCIKINGSLSINGNGTIKSNNLNETDLYFSNAECLMVVEGELNVKGGTLDVGSSKALIFSERDYDNENNFYSNAKVKIGTNDGAVNTNSPIVIGQILCEIWYDEEVDMDVIGFYDGTIYTAANKQHSISETYYLAEDAFLVSSTASVPNGYLVYYEEDSTYGYKCILKQGYKITYNTNGGSTSTYNDIKYNGISYTIDTTYPKRTNYQFTGWNTKADGTGTAYATGASYTTNADLTLYAQWKTANYGEYNGSTWRNGYTTLKEAVDGATSGNTIKLLTNNLNDASSSGITNGSSGNGGKVLKFDLVGRTVNLSKQITNYGTLDIYSSANGGTLNSSVASSLNNYGTMTFNNTSSSYTTLVQYTGTNVDARVLYNQTGASMTVKSKATITFSQAQNQGSSTNNRYIITNNGTFTLSGGTLINNLSSTTKDWGIINLNAAGKVIISSGTITTYGSAINNNAGTGNTTSSPAIKITGGTITSTNQYGVYNQQAAMVYVTGGTISGTQGIYNIDNKAGNITVTGGKITATSEIGIRGGIGPITIGTNESTPSVSVTVPSITGKTYGISTTGTFNFYDGVIQGSYDTTNGGRSISKTPNATPTNYTVYRYTNPANTLEIAVLMKVGTNYGEFNGIAWVNGYATLSEAFNGMTSGNEIQPLSNRTAEPAATLASGKKATLRLKDKTITMVGTLTNAGNLSVWGGSSSLLTASTVDTITNTGYLDIQTNISNTGSSKYAIRNSGTGKAKVQGGNITAVSYAIYNTGTNNSTDNYAIYIGSGSITSTGSNTIVNDSVGMIYITGGQITSSGSNSAVYNKGNGNITIESSFASTSTSAHPRITHSGTASGIYNNGTGTISLGRYSYITSNGNGITNNSTGVIDVGLDAQVTGTSGIYNNSSGTITVHANAKVTGTSAQGIRGNTGTVNLYQGNVSGQLIPFVFGVTYGVSGSSGSMLSLTQCKVTATGGVGVYSAGTLTLGTDDGYIYSWPNALPENIMYSSPHITGSTYGVQATGTFNFYDGDIVGASGKSISKAPNSLPSGYIVEKTTENNLETALLVRSSKGETFSKEPSEEPSNSEVEELNLDEKAELNDGEVLMTTIEDGKEVCIAITEYSYVEIDDKGKTIGYFDTLSNAVKGREGYTIKATENVTLDKEVVIPNGKKLVLDLNGKTITTAKNAGIVNNGSLTIKGPGKIIVSDYDTIGILNSEKAENLVISNNVEIEITAEELSKEDQEKLEAMKNTKGFEDSKEYKEFMAERKKSIGICNNSKNNVILESASLKVERLNSVGIENNGEGSIILGKEEKEYNSKQVSITATSKFTTAIVNNGKGKVEMYGGTISSQASVKEIISKVLADYEISEETSNGIIITTLKKIEEKKEEEVVEKEETKEEVKENTEVIETENIEKVETTEPEDTTTEAKTENEVKAETNSEQNNEEKAETEKEQEIIENTTEDKNEETKEEVTKDTNEETIVENTKEKEETTQVVDETKEETQKENNAPETNKTDA